MQTCISVGDIIVQATCFVVSRFIKYMKHSVKCSECLRPQSH